MKLRLFDLAALALVCTVNFSTLARAANPKPNIVYIVADDLGWKDVGYHGSDIKTPNIDELAKNGARLEQFYAQLMCTPTWAALMTGRYPFRYGLQTLVIPSGYKYGLPTDEYLLPQALKDAGYETAIIGKWHLGHADPKYWPRQRGFDYQYGPMIGELDYFTHKQHGVTDWYLNNKVLEEPGYTTTLLGNAAVKLIDGHDTAVPLYLYLTFNAPHTPYQAPEIGRVVAALKRKEMRDNTIIVFQSDNGGTQNAMFAGELDMSKVKIPCDDGPYRDGKASLYEGGTRVPALINWPGHIRPGMVVEGMMHVVDTYPTLLALAGGQSGKNKPFDGIDMWATISEGKPSPRTEVIYNIEPFRAGVREGDWKLIWRTPLPASVELYNIAQDPSEKNNVAAQNPDKVTTLQKCANELAAAQAKPLLLQVVFGDFREGLHMPPALPGEEVQLEDEQ